MSWTIQCAVTFYQKLPCGFKYANIIDVLQLRKGKAEDIHLSEVPTHT
jgi:hypothetical protein